MHACIPPDANVVQSREQGIDEQVITSRRRADENASFEPVLFDRRVFHHCIVIGDSGKVIRK